MRTVHAFMHHKGAGFNNRAFTGLEYHRTDGQLRRSAALQNFDKRFFLEAQCAISCVGDLDGKCLFDSELDITIIDLLLIHCDGGRSTTAALIGGEENCSNNKNPANGQQQPWKTLFLLSLFFAHRVSLVLIVKLE